tara:strand:+ start:431 stop:658 length:228 start_codon:yes stop_codon:yes gene_type:complete
MHKTRYTNFKRTSENSNKKKTYKSKVLDPKIVVDINKLLNRVKIDEKEKLKKKIIFFSLIIFSLCALGIFIAALK